MTVKEIVSKAQAFDFNPHIALKYWLRTADTLLREVRLSYKYKAADTDVLLPYRHIYTRMRIMTSKPTCFLCDMQH
jgi:hypothetical protein